MMHLSDATFVSLVFSINTVALKKTMEQIKIRTLSEYLKKLLFKTSALFSF